MPPIIREHTIPLRMMQSDDKVFDNSGELNHRKTRVNSQCPPAGRQWSVLASGQE